MVICRRTDVVAENQSIIINYSISELNVEVFCQQFNGSFYRVSIPDIFLLPFQGNLSFRYSAGLISIPDGSGFKIKISDIRSTRIVPSRKKITGSFNSGTGK